MDFNKINAMISLIENNKIPDELNFNEFAIEFYKEVKTIPLSKYLRNNGKVKRLPKIMNTRKAGEVLSETINNTDILAFLKRKGYKEVPELDFKIVMLLRKVDLLENWKKIIQFFEGGITIEEINNSTKKILFPDEIKKLEDYITNQLNLKEKELDWFLNKMSKVLENKELMKSIKKIVK